LRAVNANFEAGHHGEEDPIGEGAAAADAGVGEDEQREPAKGGEAGRGGKGQLEHRAAKEKEQPGGRQNVSGPGRSFRQNERLIAKVGNEQRYRSAAANFCKLPLPGREIWRGIDRPLWESDTK